MSWKCLLKPIFTNFELEGNTQNWWFHINTNIHNKCSKKFEDDCVGLNKNGLYRLIVSGTIRRCGLAGRSGSQEVGFDVSDVQTTPRVICSSWCLRAWVQSPGPHVAAIAIHAWNPSRRWRQEEEKEKAKSQASLGYIQLCLNTNQSKPEMSEFEVGDTDFSPDQPQEPGEFFKNATTHVIPVAIFLKVLREI